MEDSWNSWKHEFLKISDAHAPLRKSRVKHRNNPWIDHTITKSMYERDYAHQKAVTTNDPTMWERYKELRNNVTKSITKAQKSYFDNVQSKLSNNSKKFWKEMRRITGDKKNENPISSSIDCNSLNKYFAKIGTDVADTIPESLTWQWKNPESLHRFEFCKIKSDDVQKCLMNLDDESNLDALGFDSKLLRIGAMILAPSLTTLYNKSIVDKCIPTDWKFARVTPVYKGKGSKSDKSNYRPISVLCHIACIMEKEVQVQVKNYFLKHDFITIDQFAFLQNHSTVTCLHRVLDDCLEAINESELIGACFLNIKKCFDTIDHNILLKKLSKYGIINNELAWFQNYLADRSQIVACNGEVSGKEHVRIGVPQGSALGPFLFLIFINDLSQSVPGGYVNMFADDVMIYVTGKSINEIKSALQACVTGAFNWYTANRLSINSSKSNVMLIGSQRAIHTQSQELEIYLGDTKLEQVRSTRYLGIEVDCLFKWDCHVQNMCRSISGKLAMLSRLRPFMSQTLLSKVYSTHILPCIDYGITIWSNCNEGTKQLISRLQKRAARIVKGNFDYVNIRGADLMNDLGWQTIDMRQNYFYSTLMYKCIHGDAPVWLTNQILMACEYHDVNTRNASQMNVIVPKPKVDFFRKSLQYQGATVWNHLPLHVKESSSLHSFKKMYKQLFF